ncbi:hypothetical protein GBC23_02370 [Bifidobacterium longum]|nr:hypothetical protein GBC23_02370 [Bifidobacterium longum]
MLGQGETWHRRRSRTRKNARFPIVGLLALAVGSARSKCVLLISVRSPPLRERSKTSCHPANPRSGRRTIRSRQLIQC